ncbi:MAG: tyrosine-type recombinase/integrase [Anaerolineales bacterium]|jgi:site-specific recombinase XerD
MSQELKTVQKWALTSYALNDAFTDFILSRQAKSCTAETIKFYNFTTGNFISWLITQNVSAPNEITARHVRGFLAGLISTGKSSWTVNDFGRAIKTLLRFWHAEKYMTDLVVFDMPKVEKKRLPVLSADEVNKVLSVCNLRDKAIVLLMVDTGLRRSEVCALNWSDLDFTSGLLRVARGKGGKARSVVVGATTRRQLLKYRRTLANIGETIPMIQAQGRRFTGNGLLQVLKRLSRKCGIYLRPHALRRTFCILSLRAGMDVLHVQALGG